MRARTCVKCGRKKWTRRMRGLPCFRCVQSVNGRKEKEKK